MSYELAEAEDRADRLQSELDDASDRIADLGRQLAELQRQHDAIKATADEATGVLRYWADKLDSHL